MKPKKDKCGACYWTPKPKPKKPRVWKGWVIIGKRRGSLWGIYYKPRPVGWNKKYWKIIRVEIREKRAEAIKRLREGI